MKRRTHCGGQGDPEEQKRVITDRLVRWATRDAGDSSRPATAIRSVLDEYLAAQWSGRPRQAADADPFRAQRIWDGPCRHLPDQLAPLRQAPDSRRPDRASRRRADRERGSLRTQTARR